MRSLVKMENKLNKKGSHVGFVLSFVIFVTFIIFLYSITSPVTRVETGKQDLLNNLEKSLSRELFQEDITTASISLDDSYILSNGAGCIEIGDIAGLENVNSVAKNETNYKFDSLFNVKTKIDWDGRSKFIKIFYSEELPQDAYNPSGCSAVVQGSDYTLGQVITQAYTFESKVINISNYINSGRENYTKIKEALLIPSGDEFGFKFRNASENEIGTEEGDITANVYVREIPIQYIDEEANIKPGFLSIKVW